MHEQIATGNEEDKEREIVEDVLRVAASLGLLPGNKFKRTQYLTNGGRFSYDSIYNGGKDWTYYCKKAGFNTGAVNIPVDDDIYFSNLRKAIDELGRLPKASERKKYSLGFTKSRWSNLSTFFRVAFARGIISEDEYNTNNNTRPQTNLVDERKEDSPITVFPEWKSFRNKTYGTFLNFRGLQHAPANEQGVVFLFGMVCFELGFVVEAIGTGYPDCEAKRRVDKNKDYWEKVRVEFEFRSKNFKEHGHDPLQCDVIVCWEHNWPDCPIEVIELKSLIQTIKG